MKIIGSSTESLHLGGEITPSRLFIHKFSTLYAVIVWSNALILNLIKRWGICSGVFVEVVLAGYIAMKWPQARIKFEEDPLL